MVSIRKKHRKNYITLYLDIDYEGKRWWENLNLFLTGNKKDDKKVMEAAEHLRAVRMIELAEGVTTKVSEKEFLPYCKKIIEERPEYERRAYVYKHLTGFVKGNLLFKDINENFWIEFKRYLIEKRNHHQHTIHTVLMILKAILNRAVREKIISENPLRYVKEKRPKPNRTYLTFEELKTLKETPCGNEEVKKAFFFSCYTGLRISDVRRLVKGNISNNIISIQMKKTNEYINIPLNAAIHFMPDLSELKKDDHLFNLPHASAVSAVMKQWRASAKIEKKIVFHSSRHTFATMILTYGGTLEQAKELLGHSDIRDTQIYAKLIDEKAKEAVERLPEL